MPKDLHVEAIVIVVLAEGSFCLDCLFDREDTIEGEFTLQTPEFIFAMKAQSDHFWREHGKSCLGWFLCNMILVR